MEDLAKQNDGNLNPSLKLAIAMAIVESRRRRKLPPPPAVTDAACDGDCPAVGGNHSESDAIKWKRKAKQRKEEIIRLKEDLKIAEDGLHHDVFPQSVSCKCYFFDNLGQLSPNYETEQDRFGDVLRRRFLRQDSDIENGIEQLRSSVDFLVELCEMPSSLRAEGCSFRTWSHQAVDFILASLKALSSGGKIDDKVESIISSLIVRQMRIMCSGSQGDELVQGHYDFQFYVQHLMRKLGSDPFVGQRLILSASQRISAVAENLLIMDPFDGAFPKMHNGLYLMIQLIEFLISDCSLSWSNMQDFDTKLLEEWIVSVFSARGALELLESRNTLYVLYMDRVVGALTRHLGRASFKNKIPLNTLEKLFG